LEFGIAPDAHDWGKFKRHFWGDYVRRLHDGADIQDPRDLAASKILTFQNMGGEYASVGQTVASRIRIAPLGTIADQSHLVMNAATNVSRVNARIDTLTRNVSLQIDDIQSTAIGAVNTGLARIVGH